MRIDGVAASCSSMLVTCTGSHWEIVACQRASRCPPRSPEKMACSSVRCFSVAESSRYKRATPLPLKKSDGKSILMTALPRRLTPSESPSWTSKIKHPEHHPWSGSAGPTQHGHHILQLQCSHHRPLTVQATAPPQHETPRLRAHSLQDR